MIRVEKRLPMGRPGTWIKLFKKNTYNLEEEINSEVVEYNKSNYLALKMPIQIKRVDDFEKSKEKLLAALTTNADNILIKTSDSYYNKQEQDYDCVVSVDDLLQFDKNWWLVNKILEKSFYTPRKQSYYYIQLKKVSKEKVNAK